MKQKIRASEIAAFRDFAGAAAAHAVEMKAWRAHMRRVAEDERNDVPIDERHVGYPAPRVHPVVERAVDENDEANFEIIDDGPTPEQRLAARKAELLSEIMRAEQDAIARIVPPGKRRLFNMRESEIREAEGAKLAQIAASQRGILKKLTGAAMSAEDIAETIAAERSPDDTAHLLAQQDRQRRIAEIERIAAQAMHDVEDLTLETVQSWEMPAELKSPWA